MTFIVGWNWCIHTYTKVSVSVCHRSRAGLSAQFEFRNDCHQISVTNCACDFWL